MTKQTYGGITLSQCHYCRNYFVLTISVTTIKVYRKYKAEHEKIVTAHVLDCKRDFETMVEKYHADNS